jgi:hypothetical protein
MIPLFIGWPLAPARVAHAILNIYHRTWKLHMNGKELDEVSTQDTVDASQAMWIE